MSHRRLAAVVSLALLAQGVLTACSTSGAGRCVDYVALPTVHDRYRAAELVVDAQVRKTSGTVTDFSIYPEYRARVLTVLKGTAGDRTLRVIATSDQCETRGEPARYVHGDPLAKQGRLVLYLVRSHVSDVWRLVTPGSVDPAAAATQARERRP